MLRFNTSFDISIQLEISLKPWSLLTRCRCPPPPPPPPPSHRMLILGVALTVKSLPSQERRYGSPLWAWRRETPGMSPYGDTAILCPKLTLIQPTWSAYPYHLVFLIRYPYSLVFLIWYPYAPTSLYGSTAHCSGYGAAMGCYGLFIVTRTAIVMSQWYDRYCFTEYARTWARHPTTPWQRECTAITDLQSIDSLLDSMQFVTHFWEITPYILRGAIVVLVEYQCYSINARAFGPRTPYRVGGLAGDVMRAWASHSLVNHWIYTFEASLLSRLLYICTG